jgi:NhaB family Na+:H+ antiporter
MTRSVFASLFDNFLGSAPRWYKWTLLVFLALNPLLLHGVGGFWTGWVLVAEFIFTLGMALSCYPLPAGGLLALEAVALGLASPESVYAEVSANFPVLLLLMFMVAGIHFMKDLLRFVFTRLLVALRSKTVLSLTFLLLAALLSAFLDALTVVAVLIVVAQGFYDVYHRHLSSLASVGGGEDDLAEFRGFLRNLLMHAAVGTALGGTCTLVGEPQNLLIAQELGWQFVEFFLHTAPVSLPVLAVGALLCLLLERCKLFGYGRRLPESVRVVLARSVAEDAAAMTPRRSARLAAMGLGAAALVMGLGFHVAEVGLIGLSIIVLLTAATGKIDEHRIAHAFLEAMPFTALLVVFFAVVAVIHAQHLFTPVTALLLTLSGKAQLAAFYLANGLLSMISDNVFVATVYISEAKQALSAGAIDRRQFELLAVAINTGTNIPSVATPNGQAAFLFLLTSGLAPLIRLSYGRMVVLALPYTLVLSLTGLAAVWFWL